MSNIIIKYSFQFDIRTVNDQHWQKMIRSAVMHFERVLGLQPRDVIKLWHIECTIPNRHKLSEFIAEISLDDVNRIEGRFAELPIPSPVLATLPIKALRVSLDIHTGPCVFGLDVEDNIVVRAAPIAGSLFGHSRKKVVGWSANFARSAYESIGAKVEDIY